MLMLANTMNHGHAFCVYDVCIFCLTQVFICLHWCGITFNVHANVRTQSLLDNDDYIGLKHKRVRGHQYDAFIDEFLEAVVKRHVPLV